MATVSSTFGLLRPCCLVALLLLAGACAQPNEIAPVSASIGADVLLTYFGPAPSSVDPRLVGPVQLLKSGTVDLTGSVATITLPIYKGTVINDKNKSAVPRVFYYVVTDTTDTAQAQALGLNEAAKLRYALVPGGTRTGRITNDNMLVTSSGWVDFSPQHRVTPGKAPNFFPPTTAAPGSVGMEGYSPLVNLDGQVYNMPIVAAGDLKQLRKYCAGPAGLSASQLEEARKMVHDKVVSICLSETGSGGTVTLALTPGFSFGKPVLYLSLDSSDQVAAAVEAVTFAPAMANIKVGSDDSLFSAVERLFTVTNGYTNAAINLARLNRTDGKPREAAHPLRQGLSSAVRGDGSPLNVLGGIPTVATDYSPMWDLNVGRWTQYAIANNYRQRILDEFTYLAQVQQGYITNPDGSAFSSSGIIVNCPIVQRLL